MRAYFYAADIYCEDCGEELRRALPAPADPEGDSDAYPQGPYPDGGGEADTPQHCGSCGVFLDNSLTGDGEAYVRDAFREFVETGRGKLDVFAEWKRAYAWCWDDFADITFADMAEDGNVSDLMQRRFDDLASA